MTSFAETALVVSQVTASLATVGGVLVALNMYRTDRRERSAQRQVEVHQCATEQWRDIVRLAIDNPELCPHVLRGLKVGATKQHLFYEMVSVLMAHICLIESRGETNAAGPAWIAGWKRLFYDFLQDKEFLHFIESMIPYYDDHLVIWINDLKAESETESRVAPWLGAAAGECEINQTA